MIQNFIQKIIKFLLYFIFILPLAFTPFTMYPWHFGKTVIFQIIIDIAVLLAVAYFLACEFKRSSVLSSTFSRDKTALTRNHTDLSSVALAKEGSKPNHAENIVSRLLLLDWFVITFLLSQIISAVLGVDFIRSFWGYQSRAYGVFTLIHFTLFYFLLRLFFREKKDWYKLGIFILGISFISGLVAFIGPYFDFFNGIIEKGSRISGIIGNPIFFANYLMIPVFLAFAFWVSNLGNNLPKLDFGRLRGGRTSWIFLFVGLFNLLAIIFSQARGSLVGLIAGVFLIWAIFSFWNFEEVRPPNVKNINQSPRSGTTRGGRTSLKLNKKTALAGLVVLLLLGGLYLFNKKSDFISQKSPAVSRILNVSVDDTTAKTRLMAWKIAYSGFRERPVFGFGPENYQNIFDKYYNPDFLKYSFAETVWDKPHNYFLEILSTSGLVGALAYLSIIFTVFYYLFLMISGRVFPRSSVSSSASFRDKKSLTRNHAEYKAEPHRKINPFVVILAGGFLAYIVQNLFSFETSNSFQLWFFFLAFIAFLYSSVSPSAAADSASTRSDLAKLKKLILLLILILIIPFSIFSLRQNYTFLKSSYNMGLARDAADIQSLYQWQKSALRTLEIEVPFVWENAIFLAKDLSVFDNANKLDKDSLGVIAPKLEKIFLENIKKNPDSYLFKFWIAQLYAYMGEYMDNKYYLASERYFQEAWAINKDRQSIPMLLGKVYLLQEKKEKGIEVLTKLVNKDPEYAEPHWFLGLALIATGDEEEGIKELEEGKSFGLNYTRNVLYLIDLYAKMKEYKKIIPLYEILITRESGNYSFYASLAATYNALGNREKMIENLNKAVELNPSLKEEAEEFLKINDTR